ncbi:HET-domain-containing protein [Apiospora arundinis]|uniref:HET-domain-containing protein n=1 Tax=Apiospora arundinis TaxID=335852 RepID=A0ABR2IHL7_9PEZI
MAEQYVYTPLDDAKGSIRLLRLLGGDAADEIRCDFVECSLKEDEYFPYEALSYTWGGGLPGSSVFVFLDGKKKPVTRNLFEAIVSLRYIHEDRYLWIDALCINQMDDREKGHQVGQMKDVYEKAERVLVWLGPASKATNDLMDVMSLLERMVKGQPKSVLNLRSTWALITDQLGDGQIAIYREYMTHLIQAAWFRRVWIIQEIGSARVASIFCGEKSITSSIFSVMPFIMDMRPDPYVQAVLDVMPGPLRKGSWWHLDRRFPTLLGKFNGSEATRDHDRIYALVGIASDTPDLPIEYGYTFQKVVDQTVSLLVLCDASLSHLLLHPVRPDYYRKQASPFSFSRIFQGKFDIKALVLRIFEQACEGGEEKFLSYMIDNSPHFHTIAQESGFSSSYSFALSIYLNWEDSLGKKLPRMSIFRDAVIEDTYSARAQIYESPQACKLFDPGFERLLSNMSLSAFEKIIERLHTRAPKRLDTIFATAVRLNCSDHVKILLACVAGEANAQSQRQELLCSALELGHEKTVKTLQNKTTKADPKCRQKMTNYMWRICQSGNDVHMLHHVINGGADINAYVAGRTALHAAARSGHIPVVQILLKRGAQLDSRDQDGYTSLHLAELEDHRMVVLMLLKAGADELAMDREGHTPWQLNRRNRFDSKLRSKQDAEEHLIPTAPENERVGYAVLFNGRDQECAVGQHTEEAESAGSEYTWSGSGVMKGLVGSIVEGSASLDDDQNAAQQEEDRVPRHSAPEPSWSMPVREKGASR